jgi:hypothetical protein
LAGSWTFCKSANQGVEMGGRVKMQNIDNKVRNLPWFLYRYKKVLWFIPVLVLVFLNQQPVQAG